MGAWNWAGLAAGLMIGLAGAARADPPPQHITIGDLTFHYKPASLQIAREGDGLVAACVQEDCAGAVVDISRREGEDGCTLEAMAAEAERLFPEGERAYANMLPAGRFGLVLAVRHDGPELSSPAFVTGCVAWQGSEYRFAMRPESIGSQSWIDGALHYLVAQASAPAARVEQVRLGEVVFPVSTETWRIAEAVPDETVRLSCRMPTCREPGFSAALSVRTPAEPCPAAADLELGYGSETVIGTLASEAPDGIDFTTATTHLGCRNYVPPRFEACAVLNGRSYHLTTPGGWGCRSSGWDVPEGAVMDLLRGARVAR
jgi:hypothetical protein